MTSFVRRNVDLDLAELKVGSPPNHIVARDER
jgi:hypothetical protein